MARRRRVHMPNALVHISHRCAAGAALLTEPRVKALYLAVLAEVAARLGYEVLYYCLQDNHLHLILFTPPEIEDHTLASFMHRLDSTFGHRLHAFYGGAGKTWEGRYKATGWLPSQQLWVLEILLWYAATQTARRQVNAVPAAAWPWGTLYWLLRGKEGPVPTTLSRWLERLYAPRGCGDPVAAFARLARETERPDWRARVAALERAGKPWQGVPESGDRPAVLHDLRGVLEKIRRLPRRSWKLEVERHSMLLQPPSHLIF
jgi:REP element-mobilizing transposase RayT